MKTKVKKGLNIALNVVLCVFLVLCVFALIITIVSKKNNDGAVTVFGHQMRIVVSPSMEKNDAVDVSEYKIKSIRVRSMVFIELVPEDDAKAAEWYSQLKVGDVLTFKYVYSSDYIITHRIVEITSYDDNSYRIVLQGDNRDADTNVGTQVINTGDKTGLNYVIGKVTGQSYALGVLVTGIRTPVGIILLVILPCALIIVIEAVKVRDVFRSEKEQRAKEDDQKKQDEIEELKRQIAALQEQRNEPTSPPSDNNRE